MRREPVTILGEWLVGVADDYCVYPHCLAHAKQALALRAPGALAVVEMLMDGRVGAAQVAAGQEIERARERRDGFGAVLALGLGWLAEARCYQLTPDGCGVSFVDLRGTWNHIIREHQVIQAYAPLRELPGAHDAELAFRWLQFSAELPHLRAQGRAFPGYSAEFQQQLATTHHARFEAAYRDAQAISASALGLVQREFARVCQACGADKGALELLAAALAHYGSVDDATGVSTCLMVRADWEVAPRSSALVHNVLLTEVETGTRDLSWDLERKAQATPSPASEPGREQVEVARQCAALQPSRSCVGIAALQMAYVCRLEGNPVQTQELAANALACFLQAGDGCRVRLAHTHLLLATPGDGQSEAKLALAEAIGTWGATEGSFSYALGLGVLLSRAGRQAFVVDGDYERAEACLQWALTLTEALGAPYRNAKTHEELAELHQALGSRARAQAHIERGIAALEQAAAGQSAETEPAPTHQLLALLAMRSYQEAVEYRDTAAIVRAANRMKELASKLPTPVANILKDSIGQSAWVIPLYQGIEARKAWELEHADRFFDLALEAARLLPQAEAQQQTAMILAARGDNPAGVGAYNAYLAAGGAVQVQQNFLLGVAAINEEVAKQQAIRLGLGDIELGFGFMLRAKDKERASQFLQLLEGTIGPQWYAASCKPWEDLSNLGELEEMFERYELALAKYEAAIDALEQRRKRMTREELKTALFGVQGAQYVFFLGTRAALRLAASRTGEVRAAALAQAFAWSERARARALLDLLETNAQVAVEGEPGELRHWRQLTAEVQLRLALLQRMRNEQPPAPPLQCEAVERKLEHSQEQLIQAEAQLAARFPGVFQRVAAEGKIASLEDVRDQLPPDTAMLQYMTLGDELLLWGVTKQGMEAARVCAVPAALLSAKTRAFHMACAEGQDLPMLERLAAELSELLLTPLAAIIDAHERLIIVPYGELHRLPFAALRWHDAWLGQQKILTQLPSASVLPMLLGLPKRETEKTLLAVGNPAQMSHLTRHDGARAPLKPLPGALEEAKYAARKFAGTSLLGADATLAAVERELPRHRYVLFATHGIVSDDSPLLSGVALAGGELLSVQRLLALRMAPELVTLSACRTGSGTLTGGQELLGLSRAMLAAGARRLIVALWPVPDDTTSVLMARFHDALHSHGDPALALCEAQRQVSTSSGQEIAGAYADLNRDIRSERRQSLVTGQHPMRWAAFSCIGT